MSVGLNRTQIIGYVGADPRSNDDQSVAQFSVGVTERWKDRSGEIASTPSGTASSCSTAWLVLVRGRLPEAARCSSKVVCGRADTLGKTGTRDGPPN